MHKGMIRSLSSAVLTLFVLVFYAQVSPLARAADTTAPEITEVQIINVAEDTVTITWKTDEPADSTVNYGLQEDYGIVRVPDAERTEHSITINKLDPGRTYFFRVVSSDEIGNQGISANYKVLTEGTPETGAEAGEGKESQTETSQTVQSESQSQTEAKTAQEVIEQVKQIKSPEVLQEIVNETIKAIQGITEDLAIVGPPTVIPETTSAVVKWVTDRESSSEVLF